MAKMAEFGATLFVFLIVLGTAWWVGTILQASGEDKLVNACQPVDIATDSLHHLAAAITGAPPRWTLELKSYLVSGCYYTFANVLLTQPSEATGGDLRN